MEGKGGNDVYYVNTNQDEVIEFENQGIDTVHSTIDTTLAANVENLILKTENSLNGTGNFIKNKLIGNSGSNKLKGKGGKDKIIGKGDKDILTGGTKSDQFIYNSINDSGTTYQARDVITDFEPIDKINLSKIDADPLASGNQTLVFIGSDQFSEAGQVRFSNGFLSVDIDGDLTSDMSIKLKNVTEFNSGSLIL